VPVVREEEEDDDDDDGSDWWTPVGDSVSPPRTTWAQGEGRVFRVKLGLLLSPDGADEGAVVGEWWLEEDLGVLTIDN
jgi:hypothetical protein